MNKWVLHTSSRYSLENGQEIERTLPIAIPPSNGDRTDIIDSQGRYHYGMTSKDFYDKFTRKMTKEEYLESTLPGLSKEEKDKAIKEIGWTPIISDATIELIIEIKEGNITLKGK